MEKFLRIVLIVLLLNSNAFGETIVKNETLPGSRSVVVNAPATEPIAAEKVLTQQEFLGEEDQENKETNALIQMEQNRHRQIKLLNMELEQLKLQLEREKTLKEMGSLRKENRELIQDPLKAADSNTPEMKAIYIARSKMDYEAIVTINGRNYSVKKGDCPYEGVCVRNIGASEVEMRLKDNANVKLNVDGMAY
ncbi:MAG: hypothetical protein HQL25_01265 [Candidatus Omnitrophica bacterium]|nr:hypothetical protein [Candidatus Omnitrophota bacterium]